MRSHSSCLFDIGQSLLVDFGLYDPTRLVFCQKRQDEWERTSQCPPTVADQCQKDKTSGSVQVKDHQ